MYGSTYRVLFFMQFAITKLCQLKVAKYDNQDLLIRWKGAQIGVDTFTARGTSETYLQAAT